MTSFLLALIATTSAGIFAIGAFAANESERTYENRD